MDPDQDILDQLDRQESRNSTAAAVLIIAMTLIAGAIGYFTLRLELNSSRELAIDGGGLIGIAVAVALLVAYRKFR